MLQLGLTLAGMLQLELTRTLRLTWTYRDSPAPTEN